MEQNTRRDVRRERDCQDFRGIGQGHRNYAFTQPQRVMMVKAAHCGAGGQRTHIHTHSHTQKHSFPWLKHTLTPEHRLIRQ